MGPNCANFLAGIIEGILCSNKMFCKVSAHFVPDDDQESQLTTENFESPYQKESLKENRFTTLYVIKFDKEVT